MQAIRERPGANREFDAVDRGWFDRQTRRFGLLGGRGVCLAGVRSHRHCFGSMARQGGGDRAGEGAQHQEGDVDPRRDRVRVDLPAMLAVTALLALLIFKPMRISSTVAGCMLILFFAYVAASAKAYGF